MRRALRDAKKGAQAGGDGNNRKYAPGLDPLEKEASLSVIQAPTKVQQDRMLKIVNQMIASARVSADERKALEAWKANLSAGSIEGSIHQEFLRDFWGWLIGRGTKADHDKTAWGRQSLADDPEVAAYIDLFITKMHNFRLKLTLLKVRRPIGINQCFLYYKYLVRGAEPSTDNFLDDWDFWIQEYGTARDKFGQNWRDDKDHIYPHEMAPYGDARRKLAEARTGKIEGEAGDRILGAHFDAGRGGRPDEADDSSEDDPKPSGPGRAPFQGPQGADEPSSTEEDDPKAPLTTDFEEVTFQLKELVSVLRESLQTTPEPEPDRSLEARLAEAEASAAESKRLLDELRAKEATGKGKEEADEGRGKEIALLEEIVKGSEKATETLRGELVAGREERARQHKEMMDRLGQLGQPGTNMGPFMDAFRDYVNGQNQRLGQIQDNLAGRIGDSGPQIEELGTIMNGMKEAALALKGSEKQLLLLGQASEAEREAQRAAMLQIAAATENRDDFLRKFAEENSKNMKELYNRQEVLADVMRKMIASSNGDNIKEAMGNQSEMLKNLILQLPAANAEALGKLHQSVQQASNNQLKFMADMHNAMRSRDAELAEHLKKQQDQLLLTAAESETAHQQAVAARETLKQADQAFRALREQQSGLAGQINRQDEKIAILYTNSREQQQALVTVSEQAAEAARDAREEGRRLRESLQPKVESLSRQLGEYLGEEAMDVGPEEEPEGDGMEEELKSPETPTEPSGPTMEEYQKILEGAEGGEIEWEDGSTSILPEYSAEDIEKLDFYDKKKFEEVIRMENELFHLLASYPFPKPDAETLHKIEVRKLNKKILEQKYIAIKGYFDKHVLPHVRK